MTNIRIKIDDMRYDALKVNLYKQGRTLEDELNKAVEKLYESFVPPEEREKIERRLVEGDGKDRISVIRLTWNGQYHEVNHYYIGEATTLFSMAYACDIRLKKGEALSEQSVRDFFSARSEINPAAYRIFCDTAQYDRRVSALYEFDFDEKVVRAKYHGDDSWVKYPLDDFLEKYRYVAGIEGISLQKSDEEFRQQLHSVAIGPLTEEAEENAAGPTM